jgi:hypothetical protein
MGRNWKRKKIDLLSYRDIRTFDDKDSGIFRIINLFSDLSIIDGYDVKLEYKVERDKKGVFKGVCLKNWMWLFQTNNSHGIKSKKDIIDELIIKTKLNKDNVIRKYKDIIDNKFYNITIATYIMCNEGSTNDNIFHNNIYNSKLERMKYNNHGFRVVDMKLSEEDSFIFENNEIKTFFHSKLDFHNHDSFYSRFYYNDNGVKNIYFIYNSNYSGINENYFDVFQKIINLGKINLNIYDHLGNIHKYVTYHKIIE